MSQIRRDRADSLALPFEARDVVDALQRLPDVVEPVHQAVLDAGVDLVHCSQRRFWDTEFEGSNLNLAGWAKKLTGKPTVTVGSVTLGADFAASFRSPDSVPVTDIDGLLDRLERGEFDLVAVGRALLANPDWAVKVRAGTLAEVRPFDRGVLASLV